VELSQIFVSDQAKLYGIYNEKMAQEYKEKAIEQYKTLASSGKTYAINQLYKLLKDTDPDQAEQYMIQGANAGIPDCQFGLGEIYWKQGKFFDALKLFESAGEAGHPGAANRAREIYFNGAGPIQKNMDKANYWIKKVADISFGTMQKNQHL
jgi:TPR repeat protein